MERGKAALREVLQPSRAVVEFREAQARIETPVAMRWGGTGFLVVNLLALPFEVTNSAGFIRYLLLAVMMVSAGVAMTRPWFQRRWITSAVGACTA